MKKIIAKQKMIYQDPLTETKPEGMALLVDLIQEDGELERWRVKFMEDMPFAETYERWIKKSVSPSHPAS